jgi:competence protein ComEA
MTSRAGVASLVLIALVIHAVCLGRASCRWWERPALVVMPAETGRLVELGSGFCPPGIHQIYDAFPWRGVTNLACGKWPANLVNPETLMVPPQEGERLDLVATDRDFPVLIREWMPAARRLALGIPLHPDRMIAQDWEDLPGIGPVLAGRIELDRQKNGDFGSLQGVSRVKGVGAKRIEQWEKAFR